MTFAFLIHALNDHLQLYLSLNVDIPQIQFSPSRYILKDASFFEELDGITSCPFPAVFSSGSGDLFPGAGDLRDCDVKPLNSFSILNKFDYNLIKNIIASLKA